MAIPSLILYSGFLMFSLMNAKLGFQPVAFVK